MAMILTDQELIKYLEENRINPPKFSIGEMIYLRSDTDKKFTVKHILYEDGKFLYTGSSCINGTLDFFYPQHESYFEKFTETEDLERQERMNFLYQCIFRDGIDESGVGTSSAGFKWITKILNKFKNGDKYTLMEMALMDFSKLLDSKKLKENVNPLQQCKEENMVLAKKEAEQVRVHMNIKVPNVEAFKNRINELNEERKTQAMQEGKLGYVQAKDERALTDQEKEVLSHISEAFNAFIELDSKSIHDEEDFKNAANTIHRIIAFRVARRVDPDIWQSPEFTWALSELIK